MIILPFVADKDGAAAAGFFGAGFELFRLGRQQTAVEPGGLDWRHIAASGKFIAYNRGDRVGLRL